MISRLITIKSEHNSLLEFKLSLCGLHTKHFTSCYWTCNLVLWSILQHCIKNECKQTRMFAIVKEATGSSSAADSRWMNDLCVDTKLKQRVDKQMHFVTFLIHAIIWSKKTNKKKHCAFQQQDKQLWSVWIHLHCLLLITVTSIAMSVCKCVCCIKWH